jgi:hypothetical protein
MSVTKLQFVIGHWSLVIGHWFRDFQKLTYSILGAKTMLDSSFPASSASSASSASPAHRNDRIFFYLISSQSSLPSQPQRLPMRLADIQI